MDISNPRRILAVSLAESQAHLSRVIKDLTGRYPEPSAGTGALAGTSHEIALETPYYTARVPVWLDVIGELEVEGAAESAAEESHKSKDSKDDNEDSPPANPRQWADAFLAEEAREVRAVLGGVVAVVDVGGSSEAAERQRELVAQVGRLVREGLGSGTKNEGEGGDSNGDGWEYYGDDSWDGVGLAIGLTVTGPVPPAAELEAWEDACAEAGLEFVLVAAGQTATNEFGEKTGVARALEALQANDWNQGGVPGDDDDGDDSDEFGAFEKAERKRNGKEEEDDDDDVLNPESLDFGFDRGDFAGLREAIWRQGQETTDDESRGATRDQEGDDSDVQAIDDMMRKLLAARELGAGLPPDQRRRLAARAVGEVMKDL